MSDMMAGAPARPRLDSLSTVQTRSSHVPLFKLPGTARCGTDSGYAVTDSSLSRPGDTVTATAPTPRAPGQWGRLAEPGAARGLPD